MSTPQQLNPERVAVIVNEAAPDSLAVARHYLRARRIPGRNVVPITCSPGEIIPDELCEEKILRPVRRHLARTRLDTTVDFLVTTRGVPLATASGLSVDGQLMVLDPPYVPPGSDNPYHGNGGAFSHREFSFYLCTRLDAYTVPEAKALVDRSLAARPQKGVFLFDMDPRRRGGGFPATNAQMRMTADYLKAQGYVVQLDEARDFAGSERKLSGYFSWGSNDGAFDPRVYAALSFLPGAIAETAVSTSARTLRPTHGGQSLIADLVRHGVTGVKGYVSEPYLRAIARPDILFPWYVGGRNLAESFYAASAQIHWKDVVLGDPLCAPYSR
jgi:uncharacterized protein (TIGR03790 family)